MWKAWSRLLAIFIFTMSWFGLAIFGLRNIGLNDLYSKPPQSLFQQEFWLIYSPEKPNLNSYQNAIKLNKNIILGAEIQETRDGQLVICNQDLILYQNKYVRVVQLNTKDWFNIYPDGLLLEDFLANFQDATLYLDTKRIAPFQFAKSLDLISSKAKGQVLLNTQNRQNKQLAKSKNPMWIYEATTSELSKLKFMSSLFLETITQLDADFFVLNKVSAEVKSEVQRRRRPYLINVKGDVDKNLLNVVDGVITTQPGNWLPYVAHKLKSQ